MQIAEKYNKDYEKALERFRAERKRFKASLSDIEGLRVISSQANYFTVELTNGISAAWLTKELFVRHSILIKDLSKKMKNGEYVRIAIRNEEDNDRLTNALKAELQVK
jgi:histidinol-phosphate/aromatic aminotransferase/cobyric acid decarboxylase-like protein